MKKILLLCPFILLLTFCRSKKSVEVDTNDFITEEKTDSILPIAYFRFEPSDVFQSGKTETAIPCSVTNTKIQFSHPLQKHFVPEISPVGNCVKSLYSKKEETINWAKEDSPPGKVHNLTVEVALKFDPDSINTFIMGFSSRQFVISPEMIQLATLDTAQSIIVIPLDHSKMQGTTEYIWDGNWHHFVFEFISDSIDKTGTIRIFIDGKTNELLNKKVNTNFTQAGPKFTFDFIGDHVSSKNYLDELQIFTKPIPDAMIAKHCLNFFAGKHYDDTYLSPDKPGLYFGLFPSKKDTLDTKDFAPGYPDYTISQSDQLKSFPLPRFKTNTTLRRNFSWFDPVYTVYDFSKTAREKGGKFSYPGMRGEDHAKQALDLNIEMYTNWNYYFSIPSPTYYYKEYANPKTIAGAQAKYANEHPEIKTSTYLFWGGINPSVAGFSSTKPFVKTNANINPCGKDSKYQNIANDGITQQKNLAALVKVLPDRNVNRKIDFINEDGEVFGESWTPNAEGYHGNKMITCIQQDSATAKKDRARWQYEVFSTYSGQFIGNKKFPSLLNSDFSFYQISAFLPKFYGDYSEMRKINSKFRGDYYSTPDFYPGHVGFEIWNSKGAYHGLDDIADGRKDEIALGDNYFSPFICAGWFDDKVNFRPAEWLAATKALGMMGAEFYYPAYFNTDNPADKQPKDPRGYIYQIAIPVYAQATTSRYEDVLFNSKNFTYVRNYNRILIYRRDTLGAGEKFAIFAGLFPNTNAADAVPEFISNNVNIGGDILKINFSRQGSTYIYDKSNPDNIVFYQLDSWHESSHPYYWSKDFQFEAEVHDDSMTVLLKTERPVTTAKNDFTDFTTYVSFSNAGVTKKQLTYHFEPREDTENYYIWIRARTNIKNSGNSSYVKFLLDGNDDFEITGINSKEFKWYCYRYNGKQSFLWAAPDVLHELRIIAGDPYLELDKIILSRTKIPVGIDQKEIAPGSLK